MTHARIHMIAILLAVAGTTANAQYTLQTVVQVGDTVEGHTINYILSMWMNDSNVVAFSALIDNQSVPAIFSNGHLLAKTGQPFATKVLFNVGSYVKINNKGTVAFWGTYKDAGNAVHECIFTQSGSGVQSIQASVDTPIQGYPVTGFAFDRSNGTPDTLALNDDDTLVFVAWTTPPGSMGVFTQTTVQALSDTFIGNQFVVGFGGVTINNSGEIAFFGTVGGANGGRGIFTPASALFATNPQQPSQIDNIPLSSGGVPRINNIHQVAFGGASMMPTNGIFSPAHSSYTTPFTFQWISGTQHSLDATQPSGGSTIEVFSSWSQGGPQNQTITAPAVPTTYTATFTTAYQLTTAVSPPASGAVTPLSGGHYAAGSTIALAATAASGYQFVNWTGPVSSPGSASTTVVMSGPQSVTANFQAVPVPVTVGTSPTGLSIIVDGTPYTAPQTFQWQPGASHTIAVNSPLGSGATRYVFTSWSNGGAQTQTVSPAAAITYTASFTTQYQLTTTASPTASGTVTPATGGYYAAGSTVVLTATAANGYQFVNWTGPVSSPKDASTTVIMNGPQSVTANFQTGPILVTVGTSPTGLPVIVDGTTYTAPHNFQWQPGRSHTIGVDSPVRLDGTRYRFASWSNGGAQYQTVSPANAVTYTANFTRSNQNRYQLTTSVSPAGSGTVTPISGNYAADSTVNLTATAASGYIFTGWTGPLSSPNSASTTIVMSGPQSVTANFTAVNGTIPVAVQTTPQGLPVTVDGTTYTAPQIFQWQPGAAHMIGVNSPIRLDGTRYSFVSWSNGGAQNQTVSPATAATYKAKFTSP